MVTIGNSIFNLEDGLVLRTDTRVVCMAWCRCDVVALHADDFGERFP